MPISLVVAKTDAEANLSPTPAIAVAPEIAADTLPSAEL
jgi:hypothetical protein